MCAERLCWSVVFSGLVLASCASEVSAPVAIAILDGGVETHAESHAHADEVNASESGQDIEGGLSTLLSATGLSVDQVVSRACSTSIVKGLSRQLIEEIECLRPGTMGSLDGIPGVSMGDAVFPALQKPAADALREMMARGGGGLHINSALRTLPQQYLLYRWYRSGRCGIRLAAYPGFSRHESGLSIDISSNSAWRSALSSHGFRWLGSRDPVHFDYKGPGGADLGGLSVKAFQRLWNLNNPRDRIAEDGALGDITLARLSRAPAGGFSTGASCSSAAVAVEMGSMGVHWERQETGDYHFRVTVAPEAVASVRYAVEDYTIGSAERSGSDDFFLGYTFNVATADRLLVVHGYDAEGREIARGHGLIDSTSGPAFYIRQTDEATYEVGLERAPSGIMAVTLDVDEWEITDLVSGEVASERMAVQHTFSTLGRRTFHLSTYNMDGSRRGTIHRSFTLH